MAASNIAPIASSIGLGRSGRKDTAQKSLFDQIWHDPEHLEDVTEHICDRIASVYHIDDGEVHNLRKVCAGIFGEKAIAGCIV